MAKQVEKIIVCGKLDNLRLMSIAAHLNYDGQEELEAHEFDFLLGVYLDPDGHVRLTADTGMILSKACRMVLMADDYQDEATLDALAEDENIGLLYHSLTNNLIKAYFDTRYRGQTNGKLYMHIKETLICVDSLTTDGVADLIEAYNDHIAK